MPKDRDADDEAPQNSQAAREARASELGAALAAKWLDQDQRIQAAIDERGGKDAYLVLLDWCYDDPSDVDRIYARVDLLMSRLAADLPTDAQSMDAAWKSDGASDTS